MANELKTATTQKVTKTLIDTIIESLENDTSINSSLRDSAIEWWKKHSVTIVGLGVKEVKKVLQEAKSRKKLVDRYDKLVRSMSWPERIDFLKAGIDEIKIAKDKKAREAALIMQILSTSIKLLPVILTVL